MSGGQWFSGEVQWCAVGDDPGRLIARLRQADIPARDFHLHDADGIPALTAWCAARDYKSIRPLVRRTGLRVRIRRKRGVPFWVRPLRKRIGLLVGIALSVVWLWWMSGRIWAVELPEELSSDRADVVTDFLATQGVRLGAPIDALTPREIKWEALTGIPDIMSLHLRMEGCIAHVEIVERTIGEEIKPPDIKLSNIVAARDGRILSMTVLSGQQQIKVGSGVTSGTLLISGVVETKVGLFLRRAQGVVMAETARTLTAEVPYVRVEERRTGEIRSQTTLSLFGWPIPLYTPLPVPNNADRARQTQTARLFGTVLPLGVTREQIALKAPVTVTYTKEQARRLAMAELKRLEQTELKDCTVKHRTLTVREEGGACRIVAEYVCEENIAKEVTVGVHEG